MGWGGGLSVDPIEKGDKKGNETVAASLTVQPFM